MLSEEEYCEYLSVIHDNWKDNSPDGCQMFDATYDAFEQLIKEHFELLKVIEKGAENIQRVIDLLSNKIVMIGHLSIAIRELEIIQDELIGVKEDVE